MFAAPILKKLFAVQLNGDKMLGVFHTPKSYTVHTIFYSGTVENRINSVLYHLSYMSYIFYPYDGYILRKIERYVSQKRFAKVITIRNLRG